MLHADSGEQQRGNYVPVTRSNANGRLRQLYNGSLLLTDAAATDAGYYLCHASNGVGADLSKVIRLVVHSKHAALALLPCQPLLKAKYCPRAVPLQQFMNPGQLA